MIAVSSSGLDWEILNEKPPEQNKGKLLTAVPSRFTSCPFGHRVSEKEFRSHVIQFGLS